MEPPVVRERDGHQTAQPDVQIDAQEAVEHLQTGELRLSAERALP